MPVGARFRFINVESSRLAPAAHSELPLRVVGLPEEKPSTQWRFGDPAAATALAGCWTRDEHGEVRRLLPGYLAEALELALKRMLS